MTSPRHSPRAFAALAIAAIFLMALTAGWWAANRPIDPTIRPDVSTKDYPPLLLAAADDLAGRVALDGLGVSFVMTQRQSIAHREGAPNLAIEPAPGASPILVDSIYLTGYMGRGFFHGSDFFDEVRGGLSETGDGDFLAGELTYRVIVTDSRVWRDHGRGYFETNEGNIPGQGVDPFSLTRLPFLLRQLIEIQDQGIEMIDGQSAHHFVGLGESADWPGIISSDGLLFTASPLGIEAWVTDDGRLVRLAGRTANLNETEQIGVIDTVVTFGSDVPVSVPAPSPRYIAPTPEPEPSASPTVSADPSASAEPSPSAS